MKQNAAQLINALAGAPSQTAFITNRGSKMSTSALKRNVPSIRERIAAQTEHNRRMAATITTLMPNGLAAFVADAFTGGLALVNVGAAASRQDAESQIVAALEPHFETKLTDQQRNSIGMEVVLFWNARAAERKAGLADTNARLHSPLYSMAGR